MEENETINQYMNSSIDNASEDVKASDSSNSNNGNASIATNTNNSSNNNKQKKNKGKNKNNNVVDKKFDTAIRDVSDIIQASHSDGSVSNVDELKTPEIEKEHVRGVYDNISSHWSETRYKPWPKVVHFLANALRNNSDASLSTDVDNISAAQDSSASKRVHNSSSPSSLKMKQQLQQHPIVLDVGCGNGKYLASAVMETRGGYACGLDASLPLLNTAREKVKEIGDCEHFVDLGIGDCVNIPIRDHSVDLCLSIAVLHHLSTEKRRARAITEIGRVLRKNTGKALIYVWALEQPADSKRVFASSDCLVPWQLRIPGKSYANDTEGTFQRYCHVYRKGELEELVENYASHLVRIESSYYDQGNWCVILVSNVAE